MHSYKYTLRRENAATPARRPRPPPGAGAVLVEFGVRFTTHGRELPKRSSKNSAGPCRLRAARSRCVSLCSLCEYRVCALGLNVSAVLSLDASLCTRRRAVGLCAAGSFWCCFAQAAWPRRQPAPAHLAPSRPPASTGPPRVLAPMVLMVFPLLSRGQQRGLSLWTQWRSSTGRQISRA